MNPAALSKVRQYPWSVHAFFASLSNGVRNLEKLGFRVKLGKLTSRRAAEGYRSASGRERASEFMELIRDPEVRGLIATIGGYNSNSMRPFDEGRAILSTISAHGCF